MHAMYNRKRTIKVIIIIDQLNKQGYTLWITFFLKILYLYVKENSFGVYP